MCIIRYAHYEACPDRHRQREIVKCGQQCSNVIVQLDGSADRTIAGRCPVCQERKLVRAAARDRRRQEADQTARHFAHFQRVLDASYGTPHHRRHPHHHHHHHHRLSRSQALDNNNIAPSPPLPTTSSSSSSSSSSSDAASQFIHSVSDDSDGKELPTDGDDSSNGDVSQSPNRFARRAGRPSTPHPGHFDGSSRGRPLSRGKYKERDEVEAMDASDASDSSSIPSDVFGPAGPVVRRQNTTNKMIRTTSNSTFNNNIDDDDELCSSFSTSDSESDASVGPPEGYRRTGQVGGVIFHTAAAAAAPGGEERAQRRVHWPSGEACDDYQEFDETTLVAHAFGEPRDADPRRYGGEGYAMPTRPMPPPVRVTFFAQPFHFCRHCPWADLDLGIFGCDDPREGGRLGGGGSDEGEGNDGLVATDTAVAAAAAAAAASANKNTDLALIFRPREACPVCTATEVRIQRWLHVVVAYADMLGGYQHHDTPPSPRIAEEEEEEEGYYSDMTLERGLNPTELGRSSNGGGKSRKWKKNLSNKFRSWGR